MTGPLTNDVVHPKPRTDLPPGRTLTFDFPGLEIGVAEYDEGGGHRAASLRLGIGASVSLSVTRSQRPSIVALFATVGSPT